MEGSHGNLEEELQRLRWHELATFFHGQGRGDADDILNWLQRDNVQDWIAHYWFRGATPDELRKDSPEQFQELRCLAELVLQTSGLQNMREGRNPDVQAYRVFSDPLPVVHRPLLVYAGTSLLCPLISYKVLDFIPKRSPQDIPPVEGSLLLLAWKCHKRAEVMQWLGFHRERSGGLCYWKRPRRIDVDPRDDVSAPRPRRAPPPHRIGEFLRSAQAKRTLRAAAPRLRGTFRAMHQWGVETPGGAEALVHWRNTIETLVLRGCTPLMVAFDLDLANMFGGIEWPEIRAAVHRHFPEAAPWVTWCHAEPKKSSSLAAPSIPSPAAQVRETSTALHSAPWAWATA
ncbi:unnamed protein product [Symbiodinium necroappetens]|uniref:Uncharacterized protein n=1 Tax=Symbiodinium necroappetens TaxID=1628268 RepID=A0A812IX47_9DINO|nr:unnamed protein product [Symbiodinium necroappetens]